MGRDQEKYYTKGKRKGTNKYSGVRELEEEESYSTNYDYSSSIYSYEEIEYAENTNEDSYPELSTPDNFKEGKKNSNNDLSKEDEENKLKFYYFYDEIDKMLKEKSMSVLRLRTIATLSDLKEIYTKNIDYIKKMSFDKEIIKSYQEENYKILEETKELYETLISYHEKAKPESLKSYISAFKSLFSSN